ncbi:MAG: B3/4 domain-containing protein [Candidatus Aminicenantales bacterium]
MKLEISPEVFAKFPGLNVGVVVIKGANNRGQSGEIVKLIEMKEREIRERYKLECLSQQPKIQAWRKAYSAFGAKPKKYKSSVESLYRMILKGIELRSINPIVDVYNFISLKYMVPVGGDDIDKVAGNIFLRFAEGGEPFQPLNSSEMMTAKKGEIIYADESEVLCRRWNWRECDKTKMSEESKNVVLVVEGLPPVSQGEMSQIIGELDRLILKYCGGQSKLEILTPAKMKIEF